MLSNCLQVHKAKFFAVALPSLFELLRRLPIVFLAE